MITKKKILVNCSNHPSSKWTDEQKEGWDVIVDIPFPNVSPYWDTLDRAYLDTLDDLRKKIIIAFEDVRKTGEDVEEYLMLQGEFSLCYFLFREITGVRFVVPTTERISTEETLPDGSLRKTQVFRFVRWRIIAQQE